MEFFKAILKKLSSEPAIGGLAITRSHLRYALPEKKITATVQIPQGTIQEGVIQDAGKLREALKKLHEIIQQKKKGREIKVIISLPPDLIYTQSFKIPYVAKKQLHESAILNLQMITPIEAENAFMDWQKVHEGEIELELLGAFIEKKHIESFEKTLQEAGFQAATFEFPALSVTRLIEEKGFALILHVSDDGLDFYITKGGALFFDYFISWREVQGTSASPPAGGGEVQFTEVLTREVRKVSNFASSKGGGAIEAVYVIAPGMEEKVSALVTENLGMQVKPLKLGEKIESIEWAAAWGASKRKSEKENEKEIHLGEGTIAQTFFEERTEKFIGLWRNIWVVTLMVFLVLDGGFATFFATQERSMQTQLEGFKTERQQQELDEVEKKVTEFNGIVAGIERVQKESRNWYAFLVNLRTLAAREGIGITGINAEGTRITLNAEARTHETVLGFKNTLAEENGIENVDLPLSRISVGEEDAVTFSLSFDLEG